MKKVKFLLAILGILFTSHSLIAQGCPCPGFIKTDTLKFSESYNGVSVDFEVIYDICDGALVVRSTKMTTSDSTLGISRLGFFGHNTVQNRLFSNNPAAQEIRYEGGCQQMYYVKYWTNMMPDEAWVFEGHGQKYPNRYNVTTKPCIGATTCCTQTPYTPIIPEELDDLERSCKNATPPNLDKNEFYFYQQRPKSPNGFVQYIGADGYIHYSLGDTVIIDTIKPISVEAVGGCMPACFNESVGYKMTKANANSDVYNVKVYPNPITTVIKLENTASVTAIDLFNGLGQRMMTFKDTIPAEIKVDNLQKGSYYLRLYSKDGMRVERLIK
jgi:hypothetical protein